MEIHGNWMVQNIYIEALAKQMRHIFHIMNTFAHGK